MSELVLAADPRKTKVAVRYEDGTVTPAEILEANDDGTMAVKYRGASTGDWWGGTFDRDGRKFGRHPFPRLINAPVEFEEVPVSRCAIYIGDTFYWSFANEELARSHLERNAATLVGKAEIVTLLGTRKVKKPSPPEPVVLEGYAVFQAADTYEFRTVKCRNSTPATLTIKPEDV